MVGGLSKTEEEDGRDGMGMDPVTEVLLLLLRKEEAREAGGGRVR